jgi:hypothetical protein
MYPKNRSSALMALLAAGGLYAWRNRDKIQGWLSNQSAQLNNQRGQSSQFGTQPSAAYPSTGETRRIDIDTDSATPLNERRFGTEL